MNKFIKISYFIAFLAVVTFSCKKNNDAVNNPQLPTIITGLTAPSTPTSIASGGSISSDGGSAVTARGVCWSTTIDPTISNDHTTDGTGTGAFTSTIIGLTPATTYYIRAYATNSAGTAYGDVIIVPTDPATKDVYIAGYLNNGTTNLATFWKNGIPTSFPSSTASFSNSIYVSGTDVYVAGEEKDGSGNDIATLWKNGVATILSPGATRSMGNSVCVAGSDVYVAGYTNYGSNPNPTIWKNGVETILSTTTGDVYQVLISGTDVYVAGYLDNASGGEAVVWKNGVPATLPGGAVAVSLFVSGTDVYASGYGFDPTYSYTVAKIWKNGVVSSLSSNPYDASVTSLFVSGTDVYGAGYEGNASGEDAKVWKNGVAVLTTPDEAYSVYVSGTDVYAVGMVLISGAPSAMMWKNGVATSLAPGAPASVAQSVFVKD